MTKEERVMAGEFLKYLQETCPVPDVNISLSCYNRAKVYSAGKRGYFPANVTMTYATRSAHIKVATEDRIMVQVLSMLGHEYWHIVQRFRDNRDDSNPGETYDSWEWEAQRFGTEAMKEYYALMGWDRFAHFREVA
jgi:hypothetical protein